MALPKGFKLVRPPAGFVVREVAAEAEERLNARGTSGAEVKAAASAAPDPAVIRQQIIREWGAGGTPVDDAAVEREVVKRSRKFQPAPLFRDPTAGETAQSVAVGGGVGLAEGLVQGFVTTPADLASVAFEPIPGAALAGRLAPKIAAGYTTGGKLGAVGGAMEALLPATTETSRLADRAQEKINSGRDPRAILDTTDAASRLVGNVVAPGPGVKKAGALVRGAEVADDAARLVDDVARAAEAPVRVPDAAVATVVEPVVAEAAGSSTSARLERRVAQRRREIATEHGMPEGHALVERAAKADVDAKTGVYNSNAFDAARDSAASATAVDLALLGKLNDSPLGRELGDAFGDEILSTMARVMDEVAGDAGKAYRRGGDEFAILWSDAAKGDELWPAVQERLNNAVVEVKRPNGDVVQWKGIDHYAGHGKTADEASAIVNRQKPSKSDYAGRDARFAEIWKRIDPEGRIGDDLPAGRSGVRGSAGETGSPAAEAVAQPSLREQLFAHDAAVKQAEEEALAARRTFDERMRGIETSRTGKQPKDAVVVPGASVEFMTAKQAKELTASLERDLLAPAQAKVDAARQARDEFHASLANEAPAAEPDATPVSEMPMPEPRGWQDHLDDIPPENASLRIAADELRRLFVGAPEDTIDMVAVARVRQEMGDEWVDGFRDALAARRRTTKAPNVTLSDIDRDSLREMDLERGYGPGESAGKKRARKEYIAEQQRRDAEAKAATSVSEMRVRDTSPESGLPDNSGVPPSAAGSNGGGAADPPPPPSSGDGAGATPDEPAPVVRTSDSAIVKREDGAVIKREPGAADSPQAAFFDDVDAARAYADRMTTAREAARGTRSRTAHIIDGLRQLKAKAVDYNAPIEDAIRDLARGTGENGRPLPPGTTARMLLGNSIAAHGLPSQDITNAIDRSIMSDEIAGQFMRDRGFDKIIKDVPTIEHLEQYATAKQALTLFYQRWGKFVDDGVRGADNGARFKRLSEIYSKRFGRDLAEDGRLVKLFAEENQPFAQQLSDYSRDLLNYSVESGLISRSLADQLNVLYPDYVPLKRVFDALDETGNLAGGGDASLSRQTAYRKFVGSKREIESPITSLIDKTYEAFAQGERNKTAKMLAGYANAPGNPLQIRELKSGERATHTFSYLDGGKKRTFATTPEIANAAKALNVEQMSLLGRILAVPARALKVGATGLNAAFLAKNPVRDIPTAIINSEAGLSVVKSIGRGIFEAVNHGSLYDEVVREGGMFTSFDQFRLPARESIESIRSQASKVARAKYLVRHPGEMFRAVEDIVGRGEQATRIAIYDAEKARALAAGLPEAEARIAAKRAALWTTGPFHRHGEWGRVLGAAAPYLNAGIQGQRVTLAALKTRPVETFAKMAVTTLFPVAVATAWNLGSEDRKTAYASIADFEKENNIVIVPPSPTQDEKGMWNVIKIPLPQSVAKWATLLRRPIEAAHDLDPVRAGEVMGALLGTVSPVSTPSEVGANVVPQAAKPALEVSVNRNFFSRRDIEPPYMRDEPPEFRAFETTSGSARLLGKITGLSPLQVQHLVRGYGAGVGMQGLNALDRTLAAAGVIPPEQIGGESPWAMTKRGFSKAVPQRDDN